MYVDGHGPEGVGQRQRVRAGVLRRPAAYPDIRHIGGQLCVQRQGGALPRLTYRVVQQLRVGGERESAAHVGTGQVHFQGGDPGIVAYQFRDLGVVHLLGAGDAQDDLGADVLIPGQFVPQKGLDTHGGDAHTVEHSAADLGDAGAGIAGPPQAVNALDHNRAQLTDGEAVGIVFKIIIGAGGGHDGVFEHRAAQLHG